MDPPADSIDGLGFTFRDLTPAAQRVALFHQSIITRENIMGRFEDLQADIDTLRTELQETAAAGRGAIDRLTAVITTLTGQVGTLTAGQLSDADLATLNAAAAAAKAEADAVQADFDAVGQPPAP